MNASDQVHQRVHRTNSIDDAKPHSHHQDGDIVLHES